MSTIGITGGTGFVGSHLTRLLVGKGYQVVIFTRDAKNKQPNEQVTYARWDANLGVCDAEALGRLDAMIHLAGAGVADKRLTESRKKEIVDSRVKATDFLLAQLKVYGKKCKTFIAASATGFYGADATDGQPFTEDAQPCTDFLGDTCRQWEVATGKASSSMRTCILRTGIVLGNEGGAFPQFVGPMSFGVLPILGSGKQVVSWIAVTDLAALFAYALENNRMNGIYNAVAPAPVSHKTMMQTISRIKGGFRIQAHVPAFILKIALGELSEEVLKSCTVSAEKTLSTGFQYQFPDLESAVTHLLTKKPAERTI
jgi:uncharacterized protein (TIGR01777 family)